MHLQALTNSPINCQILFNPKYSQSDMFWGPAFNHWFDKMLPLSNSFADAATFSQQTGGQSFWYVFISSEENVITIYSMAFGCEQNGATTV